MKQFYTGLAAIAVIGVGFLIWKSVGGGGSGATEPIAVSIDPAVLASVQGISLGRDDAPVIIYEFADFQCPGCGTFATFTEPLIKERLVDTGMARFVFYDFPLTQIHPHAFLAARAGRCANDQDHFWDYHGALFGRQPTWSALRDATDFFVDLAGEIGLDRREFNTCLRSDRFQEEVSQSLQLGQMLGVSGTPSLFVNMKRLAGVPEYSELEQIVRAEMGETPAGDSSTIEPAPAP